MNDNTCTVIREDGDKRIYSDSTLMRHIARKLNEQGYDVIKKLAWKDGNLVSDDMTYIRSRKTADKDAFCIYDPAYNIRPAYKSYNNGELILARCNLNR